MWTVRFDDEFEREFLSLPRDVQVLHRASRAAAERLMEMGRTLRQVIDGFPSRRRARIQARYRELKEEVESLRALREAAGKAQAHIATALNIKQPSVSKIEKQTDMYLSTLRSYVEAMGGELELIVRLPSRPAMRLHQLGEALSGSGKRAPRRRAARAAHANQASRVRAGGARETRSGGGG
jgi:hypothetical protein